MLNLITAKKTTPFLCPDLSGSNGESNNAYLLDNGESNGWDYRFIEFLILAIEHVLNEKKNLIKRDKQFPYGNELAYAMI